MTFRFLEHTADVGVEVTAPDLPRAFSEAGIALFGIMTDISKFGSQESVSISSSGHDLESLLYSWLEELIYIFGTSELVLTRIDVAEFSTDPPAIRAVGYGEVFDPSLHGGGTEVKAITYHRMEIKTSKKKWILRYFVDI